MPFSPGTNTLSSLIANACLLSPRKWEHLSNHGGSQLSNINNHCGRNIPAPNCCVYKCSRLFSLLWAEPLGDVLAFCKAAHVRAEAGETSFQSTWNWHVPLSRLLVAVEKCWEATFLLFSFILLSRQRSFQAVARGAASCMVSFPEDLAPFVRVWVWPSLGNELPGPLHPLGVRLQVWNLHLITFLPTWKSVLTQRGCGCTHFCLSQVKLSLCRCCAQHHLEKIPCIYCAEQGSGQNLIKQSRYQNKTYTKNSK